jgi:hypothetical protein
MKKYLKLVFSISIYFYSLNFALAQLDSSNFKKQTKFIYASVSVGVPIINEFSFNNNLNEKKTHKTNPKIKPIYNLNFDFNFKHFSLNIFSNYCFNEFNGNSYLLRGYQTNAGSHNTPSYKYFEIYQKIKYNYLQIGTGLGYNFWVKKNNFSVMANVMYNALSKVIISSYYTNNPTLNNSDTTSIKLVKNYTIDRDYVDKSFAFYSNLKLTYSHILSKKTLVSFSLNTTFGLLSLSSTRDYPEVDNGAFGYIINYQKVVYPTLGIKYKLL